MQRILAVLFLVSILGVVGCKDNDSSSDSSANPAISVDSPNSAKRNARNHVSAEKLDPFPEESNGSANPPSNGNTSNGATSTAPRTAAPKTPSITSPTEQQVLEEMVQVYKTAKSYGDDGKFVLRWTDGEVDSWPCKFAWFAPNLVRMEVFNGKMICNETFILALISQFPGQILKIPVPKETTIASLYPDLSLAAAMDLLIPSEIFWVPPQVILLFAEDPLKTLIPEKSRLSFLPSESIEYQLSHSIEKLPCDRIKVEGSGGTRVFWIHSKTRELMRMELPTQNISSQDGRSIASLHLELEGAELNLDLSADTFTIEYPKDTLEVDQFTPWPILLQGKTLENFDSINLDSLTGTSIPLSGYADQVVVLQFWNAKGEGEEEYNKSAVQKMFSVYEKMKDDKRIQFLGVCLDDKTEISNEAVNELLQENWKVKLPTCRLSNTVLPQSLRLFYTPNLVILAPKGVIACYFPPGPIQEEEMTQAINDTLDGKIQENKFAKIFRENREKYLQNVQEYVESDYYALPIEPDEEEEDLIVPAEMPKTLKFEKRGEISSLNNPGNILVVPQEKLGQEPVFLVPFEKNSLALLDVDCRIINRTQPKFVLSTESITVVRTALDAHGKRFYAASAPSSTGGNRIHLFDENFNALLFYPQMIEETNSLMITDLRIVDLDADNDPEIVFSAIELSGDDVGKGFVRAIKLDGTALWNKPLTFPYRIGIAYTDGKPSVLSMHSSQADRIVLHEFDANGNFMKDIVLKDGNPINWFVVDDLAGTVNNTGKSQICACVIHRDEPDQMHIAEIDGSGNQDWQYPFLSKSHKCPLEYMIAANITGDATKEWIFASADGRLHFLTAKGKLIDRYAHGKAITGFNVAQIAGRPVLIVADAETITTYEIQ